MLWPITMQFNMSLLDKVTTVVTEQVFLDDSGALDPIQAMLWNRVVSVDDLCSNVKKGSAPLSYCIYLLPLIGCPIPFY